MNSLDALFYRDYNEQTYNCAHLACEAWEMLEGEDISAELSGLLKPVPDDEVNRHYFKPCKQPVTPCLVVMRSKGIAPHVGIYFDGNVLQMTAQGVQNQPLEISTRGFKTFKFYRKKSCQ